jgi:ATP-dependent DNA helicase DinG
VPAAALALRQGFGRLVRTRTDRGLVAILDRRLVTKGYGRAFLASLPRCPLLRSVDAAQRWWDGGAGAA